MSYRTELSPELRQKMWRMWTSGATLHEMGRALDRDNASLHQYIARRGGVSEVVQSRSPRVLSLTEREEISRGLAQGCSIRGIARHLGRAPSTISREIAKNTGKERYRATRADWRAWHNARRPKPCRLNTNPRLRIEVAAKLELNWSPEQVSGWLKRAHPTDPEMHVSTETIYRSLFIQARGALKKELVRHLRSGRVQRRGKHRVYAKSSKSIPDAVSIRERPADSDDRAVPGHWEGDLLYGANNSYIATLVERQSRFALLVPVKGRDTGNVVTALARAVRKLPVELRRSLTWDRGTEMAHHADFTIATNVKVFFCDPHSPWQRGSNENTNGLLRQYFPKTFDFNAIKAPQLQAVALQLNQRPRKTLGFLSPAEKLAEVLH